MTQDAEVETDQPPSEEEIDFTSSRQVTYRLRFDHRYAADPYWTARAELIDIEKRAGSNRARSETNKEKALSAYLESANVSAADYSALQVSAARPFYTVSDIEEPDILEAAIAAGHEPNEIIIPVKHIMACFVQTCDTAPSAVRICKDDQVRSFIECQPMFTGKVERDGVYDRMVPVKDGTGKLLSNQRGRRLSDYITDFTTDLIMTVAAEIDQKRLDNFVRYAGRFVGCGACRKMGYGKFRVL